MAKYNLQKGNININKSDYTFSQVYEEFTLKYFPNKEEIELENKEHIKTKGKFGISTMNNLKSAYKKCSALYKRLYKSLTKIDFDKIIF